ncbi:hypothetical protein [Wenzhouxiangella sp. XN24]|uniref:hypothetical protein n=1 Tax=Wenzhouxiangella sp. XN24 TaxID=2713569 RepID=UPI0013EB3C33|nr:hypothetical protein [Wenzhouxiangella sp. XN24]NGX14859.1 hypothetical protein [Wenzhouxiangella sp. XN24]
MKTIAEPGLRRFAWRRGVASLAVFTLLAACGGGGGGGGGEADSIGSVQRMVADVAGDSTGTVGEPLGVVPGIRVVDGSGAGIGGVTVSFRVEPGGSVSPATAVTGADGRARPSAWTLGGAAGTQVLVATATGGGEQRFSVAAMPGPPNRLEAVSSLAQSGEQGGAVAQPPAVRVLDAFGNPIPGETLSFVVEQGGGSISGSPALTSAAGVATLQAWTLGSDPGSNVVRAVYPGLPDVVFTAEALEALALSIESVQINQGTQSPSGDVDLVAGRPGLLRVMLKANRSNTARPEVRVRLFQDGAPLWTEIIPAPLSGVPTDPDLSSVVQTWNLALTGDEIRPGMSLEVVADPQELVTVSSRDSMRFPVGSGAAPVQVRTLAPLRILFIPIEATAHGRTGGIFPENVENFLASTRRWLPTAEIQAELRGTNFVTDADLTDQDAIGQLLSDLQAARSLESAGDRYYHGIIPRVSGLPISGIAFRPSFPSSSFRSALSFDHLPGAAETVAHELGHNLGRMHAPCGDPDSPDPNFPYPGGATVMPGYDVTDRLLRSASDFSDYMGYCRPRWTSDYTYQGILDWRRNDPLAVAGDEGAAVDADALPRPGLLLWGRTGANGVELNPAFRLEAAPVLPDEDGPNRLRGLAADGRVVFDLSFAGVTVPHAADPAARHFSYFVPLAEADFAALHTIELAGPQGRASHVLEAAAGSGPAPAKASEAMQAVRQDALPGGGLRVRWDRARSPVAMLRDRRSGHIMAIGRSGDLSLSAEAVAGTEPELLFSDGVQTMRATPQWQEK